MTTKKVLTALAASSLLALAAALPVYAEDPPADPAAAAPADAAAPPADAAPADAGAAPADAAAAPAADAAAPADTGSTEGNMEGDAPKQ
jgi:hypothetical protein